MGGRARVLGHDYGAGDRLAKLIPNHPLALALFARLKERRAPARIGRLLGRAAQVRALGVDQPPDAGDGALALPFSRQRACRRRPRSGARGTPPR